MHDGPGRDNLRPAPVDEFGDPETPLASPNAHYWRALTALVFGGCVIGLAPILVRLTTTGPAAGGFWRFVFALPLLAVMGLRTNGAIGRPSRLALLAGLFFTLDLGFWHYGIKFTSVANATVLTNLTPIVVTAFAWIFLRQRPRALFAAAVVIAVAGAAMMAGEHDHGVGLNPPLGDALSLTTAFWYACYMLVVGVARKTQSTSAIMFWAGIVGAPMLLTLAMALGEPILPAAMSGWLACLGLGVVHVVGQGSIAYAMGRLPTATASVVILVQPVVAALLGWLLFKEALAPLQLLGGAVALSGVVLAQWSAGRRPAGRPS